MYELRTRALNTVAGVLGLVIGGYSGRAADVTWALNGSGNWSVATNWSPSLVPGPADNVFITPTNNHTVTLDVSPTVASLTLASGILSSLGSFNSVTVN